MAKGHSREITPLLRGRTGCGNCLATLAQKKSLLDEPFFVRLALSPMNSEINRGNLSTDPERN